MSIQKPKYSRASWLSIGGVSIIALAGITAFYVDARQRVEVSNQIAAQKADASTELKELETKQAEIKKKQVAKKAEDQKAAANQSSSNENVSSNSFEKEVASTNSHSNPAAIDIIVNKKHPLNPRSFTPRVQSASCAGYAGATLSTVSIADFKKICEAAKAAGVPLAVSSSYRSYGEQVSTYNYWVSISGKSGADTYSARPGYSEHQTGLAVDFMVPSGPRLSDFTGTKQQKWLAKNAWKYGFIQRYTTSNSAATGYQAESWHFRYVGRSVAGQYTEKSATSLESFWGVSGGSY